MSAKPPNFYKAFLAQSLAAGTAAATVYVDRITTLDGQTIATGDFTDLGRGVLTVNPEGDGLTSYPENISFTAVNATTIALTSAVRGLDKSGTTQTSLMRFHPIGTPVILSFGSHQIADILSYIDAAIAAATFGTQTVSIATCGEDVSQGNLIYLKNDGKWWKTDADSASTVEGVELGIAQGAGTANGSITGGVLLKGLDTHQSGLVAGTTYYAGNTAGAISSSAGTTTKVIGVAKSTTSIYFDPSYGTVPTADQKLFLNVVTGMIAMYGAASAPTGFLLCDGTAVSRTTYAALFAVIGTTWGVGDGSTTFNVPDLRGRVPIGKGTGSKVATFASRSSNVITATGLTAAANNEFQTGQAVVYHAPSGAITGLTTDTTYYLIRTGNATFSLASTLANAQNAVAISLSSDGSGVQTFTLTLTARTLGDTGGEENHAMSATELLSHTHPLASYFSLDGSGSNSPSSTADANGTNNTVTSATGGNAAMNVMQPFGTVNFIIKY